MLGDDRKVLEKLRENVKQEKEHSWHKEWVDKFGPIANKFLI